MHLASELLRSGKCCLRNNAGEPHEVLRSEAESRYGQALHLLRADFGDFDIIMSDSILATSSVLFVFNTTYEDCADAEERDLSTC